MKVPLTHDMACMKNMWEFLETSTIHGLSRIASSKMLLRLFWSLIVLLGFTTAGYLITNALGKVEFEIS